MKNSYTKLFNVCEAGELFVEDYNSDKYTESNLAILSCLINIEAILNAGRTLTSIDSETDKNDRNEVNKRMDNLRSEIRKIIDRLDKKVFHDFMQDRAKSMEISWG